MAEPLAVPMAEAGLATPPAWAAWVERTERCDVAVPLGGPEHRAAHATPLTAGA